jgi:hypothetical protein
MLEADSLVAAVPGTRVGRSPRRFYVALAALMTLLVVVGFWPSYYGPLLRGTARTPAILHVHGVIFIGWMALLIVQATLAARGRVAAHRALGNIGIGYGVFVWLVGLLVSFAAPVIHVHAAEWSVDDAAAFLPIPLGDMLLFGGFFAAAVLNRHKPELHKRLMLLATVAILFAAAFRLEAAGVPMVAALALWFAPVVLCMAYDLVKRGRIHGVYWVGLAAMALALLRLPFRNTELWLGVGRPLFDSLT